MSKSRDLIEEAKQKQKEREAAEEKKQNFNSKFVNEGKAQSGTKNTSGSMFDRKKAGQKGRPLGGLGTIAEEVPTKPKPNKG